MEMIHLQLDEQTLDRAKRLSKLRQCTLEELIKDIIEQIRLVDPAHNHVLGMFADEPGLMDQVVESAMVAREQHPFRSAGE